MTKYLRNSLLTIVMLSTAFFVSCVESDSTFGGSDIPSDWEMKTTIDSSITPLTYTYSVDSVLSSPLSKGYRIAGSFVDPIVGRTTAGFFTHYTPFFSKKTSNGLFGKDPVIDSMRFGLAFADFVGDTTVAVDFEVYEVIKGDFKHYKRYYTNMDMTPYINDTALLKFSVKKGTPYITKLPEAFYKKFLLNNYDNSNPYLNDTLFIDKFKGFYVKAKPVTSGEGCMYTVSMSESGLALFYHNNDPEKDTTLHVSYYLYDNAQYTMTPYNVSFNTVQHDYSFADPAKGGVLQSEINNESIEAKVGYIQGFGGLGVGLKIAKQQLDDLLANTKRAGFKNIAIHAAELIVEVENPTWENYDKMFTAVAPYLSLSELKFTPDYNPFNTNVTSVVGGSLNRSNGRYTLNITAHLQRLLTGSMTEYSFQLEPKIEQMFIMNRSTIKGSASNKPPRIVITYSMLK